MADVLLHLLHGGSWGAHPWGCRSAYRNHDRPDDASDNVGFRVVCFHQDNDHTIQLEEQANG